MLRGKTVAETRKAQEKLDRLARRWERIRKLTDVVVGKAHQQRREIVNGSEVVVGVKEED